MQDHRIIAINLDAENFPLRSSEHALSREVAVADILVQNFFAPAETITAHAGPYALSIRAVEGRLSLDIFQADGQTHERSIILGLAAFRRVIRDYGAILRSHEIANKQATPQQIETIDMARRGLHNQGAELLIERLRDKIEIDFETARRLFALIYTLYARG